VKVRRFTRLLLACIGDVSRDRRRVAQAWRAVRRSSHGISVRCQQLWRWQKRLARSIETLAMLWALCVK
jgi:hypothetical protein